MLVPIILLAAILAVLAVQVLRGGAAYARFKALTDTRDRKRVFLKWALNAFILFGGLSLFSLALLGRLEAIVVEPVEFTPLLAGLGVRTATWSQYLLLGLGALLGGGLVGIVLRVWVLKRPMGRVPVKVAGDTAAMLTRNDAERWAVLPLCLNAGFSEELMFRLVLPLLMIEVGAPAWAAMLAAAVLFGLTHLYQGWRGVLATLLIGLAWTFVYLLTGQLWIVMALHAVNNIVVLIVRPWLASRAKPEP